jgi:hypothetical protein
MIDEDLFFWFEDRAQTALICLDDEKKKEPRNQQKPHFPKNFSL